MATVHSFEVNFTGEYSLIRDSGPRNHSLDMFASYDKWHFPVHKEPVVELRLKIGGNIERLQTEINRYWRSGMNFETLAELWVRSLPPSERMKLLMEAGKERLLGGD